MDAIMVFTGRSLKHMLVERGSQAWVLDPRRARGFQYLVCTQNRQSGAQRTGSAPHASAFIVAKISDIVESVEEPSRYNILFDEFAQINIPGAWKGWRNPVRYTTLEELGISLAELRFERVSDAESEGTAAQAVSLPISSLVLELQSTALDKDSSITDLLRRVKVVASKLGRSDILQWVNLEIQGYPNEEFVPDYRELHGTVKGFNPYHGWLTVMFEDSEVEKNASTKKERNPISEIEALLEEKGALTSIAGPGIRSGLNYAMEARVFFSASQLRRIVDAVRNKILDWALALEKQGVLGEGMTFSESDKKQAASVPSISIGFIENFAGSVGGTVKRQSIVANPVVLRSFEEQVREFTEQIDTRLKSTPADEASEVHAAVDEVRLELAKPNRDENLIKKALRKIPAAAVVLSKYATQQFITLEVAKLIGAS